MTISHTGIIVHCTATRPDWWADKTATEQMKEIDRWHREDRGWRMIGYHFFVSRNGEVIEGRPLGTKGAHAKGHNDNIGIAIAGGFGSSADDMATEHYTPVQLAALFDLIKRLQSQYNIKTDKVIGHNKISPKSCPGFRCQKWFSGMALAETTASKPERTKAASSKTVQASAATIAASAGTSITALAKVDQTSQYIILAFCGITVLLGMYIMKERIKAWGEGWK
jgi:N-acetyl-anhydromuramyl-L-alanine amidase AmpD